MELSETRESSLWSPTTVDSTINVVHGNQSNIKWLCETNFVIIDLNDDERNPFAEIWKGSWDNPPRLWRELLHALRERYGQVLPKAEEERWKQLPGLVRQRKNRKRLDRYRDLTLQATPNLKASSDNAPTVRLGRSTSWSKYRDPCTYADDYFFTHAYRLTLWILSLIVKNARACDGRSALY